MTLLNQVGDAYTKNAKNKSAVVNVDMAAPDVVRECLSIMFALVLMFAVVFSISRLLVWRFIVLQFTTIDSDI